MSIRAAIEISAQADYHTQQHLIASAYRLSRQGKIVLILNGIDRETIDRFLDPIVAHEGVRVAGVLYVDAAPDRNGAATLQRASTVITSSQPLCDRLRAEGVDAIMADRHETVEQTLSRLQ